MQNYGNLPRQSVICCMENGCLHIKSHQWQKGLLYIFDYVRLRSIDSVVFDWSARIFSLVWVAANTPVGIDVE